MTKSHSNLVEHEVAIIVIRDHEGSYFITQRRPDKPVFPSRWGVGAGGKLEPGEEPLKAATRELQEETGLVTSPTFLFSMTYSDDDVLSYMHVFETVATREDVGIDLEEWSDTRWIGETELHSLAHDSDELCPDTAAFVRRLLSAD